MTTSSTTTSSTSTVDITNTANTVSTTDTTSITNTVNMGTLMSETTSKNEDIAGLLCTADPRGMDYRGTLAITSNNRTCQRWDKTEPHYHGHSDVHFPHDANISQAENYCRSPLNPKTAENQPWCYTTDPGIRWELCSIPICPSSTPTATTSTSCMPIHTNSIVSPITYTTAIPTTMVSLLTPTDPITCLCNTVRGGYSLPSPTVPGYKACESPHSEQFVNVILDGNLDSVHLNFGSNDESVNLRTKGVGTGFVVVPQSGGFSVLQAFQFGTGADSPNRDPITITIEGSQFNNSEYLQMGSSWNPIYDGWTGINMNNSSRSVYGALQTINNACPYRAYRVLITSQRGEENSVQYSEVQFFGYFIN